ncbi:MAG: CRISPR-associated endonuclease Cas3'' [Acidimicrobiaceae bacterium]|nr:CRISPR-associated endonuclease Cas3'' [Acidimicrobiaceae bacterium]
MSELQFNDFTEYFQAVHGYEPYPWQSRLTRQVLERGHWPDVIDLPTGTGKTAVIDTAIFALAARPDISPRRIVFVIDRRIIVDQVYKRAERIRNKITEAESGVLATIRGLLENLAGVGECLGIAALRGGIPINGEWARKPDQPWIIVSTVDQFGSRLLFRGYGVSPKMRSVHAGLAGNDCLVILDEVHLNRAFASTLRDATSKPRGEATFTPIPTVSGLNSAMPAVPESVEGVCAPTETTLVAAVPVSGNARVGSTSRVQLPRRFGIVEMSATPENQAVQRFGLQDSDLEQSSRLKKIAQARKRAKLVTVKGTRPPHVSIPKKVLEIIKKELNDHECCVGVVVNRVRTARETHALLKSKGIETYLITGRMRPLDRQKMLEEISHFVNPDRQRAFTVEQLAAAAEVRRGKTAEQRSGLPTVIVATQAIEVGADFSFDALISEVAPIDSLTQRFGRLDRRGELASQSASPISDRESISSDDRTLVLPLFGRLTDELGQESTSDDTEAFVSFKPKPAARCWILGVLSTLKPNRPDPIYGDSCRHTWKELRDLAENDYVDVSPDANLLKCLSSEARAPKSESPLLLSTHADAWSQTNPLPVVDPPIVEFLHGKHSSPESDVSVVWRVDLSEKALEFVPPRLVEFLPIPISAFKTWVQGHEELPVADVDGAVTDTAKTRSAKNRKASDQRSVNRIVKWRGGDITRPQPLAKIADIRPGDMLVVPCEWGGLTGGTWDPSSEDTKSVSDLGDEAQLAYASLSHLSAQHKFPVTIRLDHRLLGSSVPSFPKPADEVDAEESLDKRIRNWLNIVDADSGQIPEWLKEAAKHLKRMQGSSSFQVEIVEDDDDASRYYVLVGGLVDPDAAEGDADALSLTGTEKALREHLAGVGDKAAKYGRHLGLPEEIIVDLRLAGELHDLGKIDTRFQQQMCGNDPVRFAELDATGDYLAKSLPGVRTNQKSWPPVRHEFSSVALSESNPEILKHAHDPDLVLHLVGSHHGHGRPLPRILKDDNPQLLKIACQFYGSNLRLRRLSDDNAGGDSRSPIPADCSEPSNSVDEDNNSSGDLMVMSVSSNLAGTSLALEMADRFWRLQQRYGYYGLAWLEAIFRLADHQRSAEEEK